MIPIMRLMKILPEKRLALFLLISVTLVWGQTATSGRSSDSSMPPTSFPAPTPAALATAEHAISGHDPGPSGPSPVTDLLKLLLANVNSTEAMTNMEAMWATDRYFPANTAMVGLAASGRDPVRPFVCPPAPSGGSWFLARRRTLAPAARSFPPAPHTPVR